MGLGILEIITFFLKFVRWEKIKQKDYNHET
jgi:hypothetical protein